MHHIGGGGGGALIMPQFVLAALALALGVDGFLQLPPAVRTDDSASRHISCEDWVLDTIQDVSWFHGAASGQPTEVDGADADTGATTSRALSIALDGVNELALATKCK